MDVSETLSKKLAKQAEMYHEKYRDQMDALEKSPLIKLKGSLDKFEAFALGKQLEQFELYKGICEEQGNVNLLGKIPDIAFDVITAVHGASVIPVISSVQPIEEERGTIYFKNLRSATTKGSQTAGNVIIDPRTNIVTPSGYSNAALEDVVAATTVAAQLAYAFTLAAFPIKSESLSIKVAGLPTLEAKDVGGGKIYGVGLSGSVNYATGAVTLNFAADPGVGHDILVSYQQNYELSADIPQIDVFFDSKALAAKIYALKGTYGLMQSFGMSKRFGLSAADELSKDLVVEINREIGADLVRKLKAYSVGTTTFSKAAPSGVSYFEHKQTYKDSLAATEKTLVGNAGRGSISVLIAGLNHCSIIQTLPGFTKLYDGQGLGMHVFGTLDGITVIRVTETAILGADEAIGVWKGLTPFETAAIYAPYMPLAVTGTLPIGTNPLVSQQAAAVWGGVDVVVGNFATKFNLVP